MQSSEADATHLKAKIEQLRGLKDRDFAVWQFFEGRADQVKIQLWTSSTWLIALQGGLLAFIFSERLTSVGADGTIVPKIPLLVTAMTTLGLGLSLLTFVVAIDAAHHVRTNWDRASPAKGDYEAVLRSGRIHTLPPILAVDALFAFSFFYLLLNTMINTPSTPSIILATVVIVGFGLFYVYGVRRAERPEAELEWKGGGDLAGQQRG